jgi:hypothetical protein
MHASPTGRLARVLRERRALSVRLRRGAITRDEYATAVRTLVEEARLQEPDLARPWWADDLGWLMRAIAQAVHSLVLRDGEHVMFLRRDGSRFRRSSLAECRCLAVHLESALPVLVACGFGLSLAEADRALALAADTNVGLVVRPRVQVYFHAVRGRRNAVVFDWTQVQTLGAAPRRGDPRGR